MSHVLLIGLGVALGAIARPAVNQATIALLGTSLLGTFITNKHIPAWFASKSAFVSCCLVTGNQDIPNSRLPGVLHNVFYIECDNNPLVGERRFISCSGQSQSQCASRTYGSCRWNDVG